MERVRENWAMTNMSYTLKLLKRKLAFGIKFLKSGNINALLSGLSQQKKLLSASLSKEAYKQDSLVITNLDLIVTQKCTLKCKDCSNLMQHFDNKNATILSLDDVCRDFDLLMQVVDYISYINIIGGEPLLFKDLAALICYIESSEHRKKIGLLRIVTNGTIIPSQEVLTVAAKHDVIFYVSDYGKLSVNLGKLKKELKRYRIPSRIGKVAWFECRRIIDGRERDEKKITELYQKCDKDCKTLVNGKFYHCPFLAHGETLQIFPFDESNHINLLNMNITKEDIKNYLSEAHVPPGCRYCSGGHSFNAKPVPMAVQTKEPVQYERYSI